MLFVFAGARLEPVYLRNFALVALAFIATRLLVTTVLTTLLAHPNGISTRKGALLGVSLVPLSGFKVILVQHAAVFYPEFGSQMSTLIVAILVILEVVGPICTRYRAGRCGRSKKLGEMMLEFTQSTPLTMGVELELQIVNRRDYDLTRGASDLLALLRQADSTATNQAGDHREHDRDQHLGAHAARELLAELQAIRDAAGDARPTGSTSALRRRHAPVPALGRPAHLPGRALPASVASCTATWPSSSPSSASTCTSAAPNGDDAVFLLHLLARYMPHFIALSASSPFYQGVDTQFQSSRLNSVIAFPLSRPHAVHRSTGTSSTRYFDKMARLRHRREHEGLLLGHPAQARIRHDRDPRLRHAADGRDRRRAGRLMCNRWPVLFEQRELHAGGGRLPDLHVQPLPGLPLRPGGTLINPISGESCRCRKTS